MSASPKEMLCWRCWYPKDDHDGTTHDFEPISEELKKRDAAIEELAQEINDLRYPAEDSVSSSPLPETPGPTPSEETEMHDRQTGIDRGILKAAADPDGFLRFLGQTDSSAPTADFKELLDRLVASARKATIREQPRGESVLRAARQAVEDYVAEERALSAAAADEIKLLSAELASLRPAASPSVSPPDVAPTETHPLSSVMVPLGGGCRLSELTVAPTSKAELLKMLDEVERLAIHLDKIMEGSGSDDAYRKIEDQLFAARSAIESLFRSSREEAKAAAKSFLVTATEGSTARTEAPASDHIPPPDIKPHIETIRQRVVAMSREIDRRGGNVIAREAGVEGALHDIQTAFAGSEKIIKAMNREAGTLEDSLSALLSDNERLRSQWEGLAWHGCLTGDCPHDTQAECDASLANSFRETVAEDAGFMAKLRVRSLSDEAPK